MPSHITIRKTDGTDTNPMPQRQAEIYLSNLIHRNRVASLKQAMNDVYGDGGKATGAVVYEGFGGRLPVKHASSGNGQHSVSLFYVKHGGMTYLLAMGEHMDLPSPKVGYSLCDYGQPDGDLKNGKSFRIA